ncbi:unnamed protein product [Lactuca saligna]|uniref:Uncharacterized protein n=1 Tax=Lactuca saligna TaxID=75948 RepID=A0AA36EAU0_LACSI|nr:unnamed protein product [Lactuca saligna]
MNVTPVPLHRHRPSPGSSPSLKSSTIASDSICRKLIYTPETLLSFRVSLKTLEVGLSPSSRRKRQYKFKTHQILVLELEASRGVVIVLVLDGAAVFIGWKVRFTEAFFAEVFKKTIQKHGQSGGVISLSEEYSFKESRMAARSRNNSSTYSIRKLKRLSITILSFSYSYIALLFSKSTLDTHKPIQQSNHVG